MAGGPLVPAAIGDMYQVRICGRMEGQETANVLHFACASSDSDVELHLILVLASCFITNILPAIPSDWVLENIKWKKVSPALSVEHVTIPPGAGPGGSAVPALPSFVSALVSLRTNVGGRSHRGRLYLAGIPEPSTQISALDVSSAYWLALVAFVNCVASAFSVGDPPGGDSWQLGVYSRKIGGSTFPYGAAGFTPVSALIPQQQLATTRSRKVGRGS